MPGPEYENGKDHTVWKYVVQTGTSRGLLVCKSFGGFHVDLVAAQLSGLCIPGRYEGEGQRFPVYSWYHCPGSAGIDLVMLYVLSCHAVIKKHDA